MERREKRLQDPLQKDGKSDVKFTQHYDLKVLTAIAKASGSTALIQESRYLRRAKFYAKGKFWCEILGDIAFYAGTIGKSHFRLIEIAVRKEYQGRGYGRRMMWRIFGLCRKRGLSKITLRTSREESAVDFYKKFGGIIVGQKDGDYEMEIKVCFTA